MEQKKGQVRYRTRGETNWSGRMPDSLLTPETVQIRRFQGYEFEKDFSHIPDLQIPKPPKDFHYKQPKKSELKKDITYILCPDKKCGLFWHESFFACEYNCPKKDLEKKVMVCGCCMDTIVLESNYSLMRSVRHNCKDGKNPLLFRSSRHYEIIYKLPK